MRSKGFFLIIPIASAIAFGAALTSCTSKPRPESGVLRVHLSGEPVTLDPSLTEDALSFKVVANVMEGLMAYDGAGSLRNRLAESYQLSADGKRLEFRLRPGLKWSDGKPLRAADFVFGIRRSLRPETGSKLSEFLKPIREIRAPDDRTLIIELSEPSPSFLQVLTLPVAMPQREDVLAAPGGIWPASGPYRISARVPDRSIVLEPNPYYWGAKPSIRKVEFQVVRDESTAVHLFEQGRLDILTRIPTLDLKRLKEKGVLHTDPFPATYYLGFNCRKAPFRDRAWRRAVSGSIRRNELAQAVATGETPARSWIPEGLEGFIPWTSDREMAAVFADSVARVKPRAQGRAIEVATDSSERNSMVLEKVQHDLAQSLGIKLSISGMEWKSHIRRIQTDPPPMYRFGWLAPIQDPIPHLQALTTGNPNNYTGCSSPRYDRLVEEIGKMAPSPEREAKVREAERILVDEEAFIAPLYHYVQNHAFSKRVANFRVNFTGVIHFEELGMTQSENDDSK